MPRHSKERKQHVQRSIGERMHSPFREKKGALYGWSLELEAGGDEKEVTATYRP